MPCKMQYVPGIKIICTAHGDNLERLKQNNNLKEIINYKFFEKIIFLKSQGKRGMIDKIFKID